jgi:hypothetical protein
MSGKSKETMKRTISFGCLWIIVFEDLYSLRAPLAEPETISSIEAILSFGEDNKNDRYFKTSPLFFFLLTIN